MAGRPPRDYAGAVRRLLLVALLPVILSACGGADSRRAEGEKVFADAGCAGCHTLADANAVAKVGPDLDQLQPGVSRTVRQVTNGGRGMPAFKGRLTDEEILAVAQYVDGVAGRGTQAAAAFRPDERTLESCDRKPEQTCYDQAFGNLVYEEGPEKALAELEQRLRDDPSFACHRTAHTMGAAALVRFKGDVANAFIDGSPVCASGYYHGVLERGFSGVEDDQLDEKARALCADPQLAAQPFLQFQCYHGLGHGLMIYTSYEMPLSLKTCDALQDDFGRSSCAGGVFMENSNTSYGTQSKWLKDDDLIYPCNTVEERHKYACYQLVTARIRLVKPDWRDIAAECRKSEPRWVAVCFESMGRDVSGDSRRNVRMAARLCRAAGPDTVECVYGAAREIVNADSGGERAARFCRLVSAAHRPRCYEGMGTVLSTLERDDAGRRRTCAKLAGRYARDCRRGAGVAG
jgi:mono/diheme cytochrome c family protein